MPVTAALTVIPVTAPLTLMPVTAGLRVIPVTAGLMLPARLPLVCAQDMPLDVCDQPNVSSVWFHARLLLVWPHVRLFALCNHVPVHESELLARFTAGRFACEMVTVFDPAIAPMVPRVGFVLAGRRCASALPMTSVPNGARPRKSGVVIGLSAAQSAA